MTTDPKLYRVLVTEDLFIELGGDRVDWGEPDADGFYSPTVLLDDEALADALHAAIHGSHPRATCVDGDLVMKAMVPRFRAARTIAP